MINRIHVYSTTNACMFCIHSFYTLGGLLVADSSPSGLESSGGAAAVETMTEEELVQCLCRKVKNLK